MKGVLHYYLLLALLSLALSLPSPRLGAGRLSSFGSSSSSSPSWRSSSSRSTSSSSSSSSDDDDSKPKGSSSLKGSSPTPSRWSSKKDKVKSTVRVVAKDKQVQRSGKTLFKSIKKMFKKKDKRGEEGKALLYGEEEALKRLESIYHEGMSPVQFEVATRSLIEQYGEAESRKYLASFFEKSSGLLGDSKTFQAEFQKAREEYLMSRA